MRFFIKTIALSFLLFLVSCTNTLEPANGTVDYTFSVSSPTEVLIEVENNYNTVVYTLFDNLIAAGTHRITWEPDDEIPAGIYYIKRYESDTLRDVVQIVLYERSN